MLAQKQPVQSRVDVENDGFLLVFFKQKSRDFCSDEARAACNQGRHNNLLVLALYRL